MIQKPFNLRKLPLDQREELPWGDFGSLSFSSISNLSSLDGMMRASAKADLFWISWLMKEAQFSNEIEGTVTTFEEVMGGKCRNSRARRAQRRYSESIELPRSYELWAGRN